MIVAEHGWVAQHPGGPWHRAVEGFDYERTTSWAYTLCHIVSGWHFWRLTRPPREQICKRCLKAEERER